MSAEVPVGVVGIGCKLPGGCDSKELYYSFLRQKVCIFVYAVRLKLMAVELKGDGMTTPPPDRWDHAEWKGMFCSVDV